MNKNKHTHSDLFLMLLKNLEGNLNYFKVQQRGNKVFKLLMIDSHWPKSRKIALIVSIFASIVQNMQLLCQTISVP